LSDPELAGASVTLLAYDPLVGALGVRLGRALQRPAAEVLGLRTARALAPAGIYDGGPVRDAIVLVVRLKPDTPAVPGYRAIDEHFGTAPTTTDPDVLDGAWVFLGYVGWRPGQLEVELARGAFVLSHRPVGDWLTQPRGD
jgi:putative transcriptional regulator